MLSLGQDNAFGQPLLAQGLTAKSIARELVIAPKTVDSHVQHIYTKIGMSTRGAAVLFAVQARLT